MDVVLPSYFGSRNLRGLRQKHYPEKYCKPKNGILRSVMAVAAFIGDGVVANDMHRHLWRKENFACVRIFYRGSRRKTEHLDVTGIRRERTRDQAWFTGDGSSIWQVTFLIAFDRSRLRPAHIWLTRRGRGWRVRSRTVRSVCWRSFFTLVCAAVRPRRLFRVSDCAAERSEKIPERPCFRGVTRSK